MHHHIVNHDPGGEDRIRDAELARYMDIPDREESTCGVDLPVSWDYYREQGTYEALACVVDLFVEDGCMGHARLWEACDRLVRRGHYDTHELARFALSSLRGLHWLHICDISKDHGYVSLTHPDKYAGWWRDADLLLAVVSWVLASAPGLWSPEDVASAMTNPRYELKSAFAAYLVRNECDS